MKHLLSVAILPLILGGCASTYPSEVTASRAPSDLSAEVVPSHHHNPVAGYQHRDPVNPKPWRKLNDDAASEGSDAS
ncbi:hypothetical protein IHQ71_16545 [Rhizobium sp. TH2]|uniref:hypothetical protein n=1 Tax=Rhizobium sp. TH2 TaxID=2775403 RepID=UPI002157FB65|nr:hypothetical protein [Rhizobium sp. TH2]UVC06858.1 hypothetical protein IHQ71_16545 [Rhizobium sp. TH2]